eukprot:gb/GEZN01017314.1/.p1 GENE.gb/GEZN01017314.1/~~gb/GEZN01017314.1/.p1  ORF type:complete len:161 (-),score=12.20 gb/GEZN01017314.1/:275-757(-)
MGSSNSTETPALEKKEEAPLLSATSSVVETTQAVTPVRAAEQGLLSFQSPHPVRGYKEPSSAVMRQAATKLTSVNSKKTRRPSSARKAAKAATGRTPRNAPASATTRRRSGKLNTTPKSAADPKASASRSRSMRKLQSPQASEVTDPKLRKMLSIEMNLS